MFLTNDISKIQTFPRVFLGSTQKSKKNIEIKKRTQRFCEHFGISVIFVNMQVCHQVQTRTPFSLISRRLCFGCTFFAICCSAVFEVCLVSENSNSTGIYGAFCG